MKLFALGLALAGFAIAPSFASPTSDEVQKDNGSNVGRPRKQAVAARPKDPLAASLEWLAEQQSKDGSWEGGDSQVPTYNVGVTGLAILSFLECGHTTQRGDYQSELQLAMEWLQGQVDMESGEIGEPMGPMHAYNQGIGTLALIEMYAATKEAKLRAPAESAVQFVLRSRNPYGAWRYDSPPTGDNDTSITGWMVLALVSAEHAGIPIDTAAFDGALSWIDEVTDPKTGRVGYDSRGSRSSRIHSVNEHFPTDTSEAMTAVGMMMRGVLGEQDKHKEIMAKHAGLMLKTLPEWDPKGFECDMYYWYFGSIAMRFADRHSRRAWKEAMRKTLTEAQRAGGEEHGSWDPVGPWGTVGGRVYSTSLLCMALKSCAK